MLCGLHLSTVYLIFFNRNIHVLVESTICNPSLNFFVIIQPVPAYTKDQHSKSNKK